MMTRPTISIPMTTSLPSVWMSASEREHGETLTDAQVVRRERAFDRVCARGLAREGEQRPVVAAEP